MNIATEQKQITNIKKWDLDHLWHPYTQMATYGEEQMVVTRAVDWKIYDSEGNEYIDGIAGLWNVNVGHGREEIIESIFIQLKELDFFSLNGYTYESAANLAKILFEISPRKLNKVFFANGGAEANETAIKLARAYWKLKNKEGKYKIISLNSAWHGGTLGALSASHIASEKRYFEPMPAGFIHLPQPNCYRCPFGKSYGSCKIECANFLRDVIEHEDESTIAAFIGEPIQGVGGVIVPPDEYWPKIREICDEYDILLIIDEVATGFGRTGSTFAITQWGIEPDMMVVSKGITSGYLPLSAVLSTDDIYEPFLEDGKYFQHGYTTGGHPASCAAAVTNIEILKREGLLEQTNMKKDFMISAFSSLLDINIVGNVRGRGFMIGVELVYDKLTKQPFQEAKKVCRILREKGVIVRPIGNLIPFFPPLNITEEDIQKVVGIYQQVLLEVEQTLIK